MQILHLKRIQKYGGTNHPSSFTHAPYPDTKKKSSDEATDLEVLAKKRKKYSEEVQSARAWIESPFGHVKQIFKALSSPWYESNGTTRLFV